ncbi:Mpo1-like protein [Pseudomonas sp. Irchel s3h17]|uniref:Mpo1-like protein n=1 Tax=Pseudomonas sp. Irchel s3h17 TaxID=2009182 RepID=UPI000BA45A3B|nr:Mpo1-like protein [Pseudomonas sp. Irchel s3h17]
MGKRHPNLPAWQWREYPNNHQHPTNLVLHLIAVPLFILAFLLIVSGVFGLNLGNVAIGIVGLLAALGLQRHGHRLEAQASEPFSDRKDAVSRLLVEQFLTFPRFLFSGRWWRAWCERHRHKDR